MQLQYQRQKTEWRFADFAKYSGEIQEKVNDLTKPNKDAGL
jgi:hypothetical protein